ncbi:MAG: D-aminoacyl-tRNA deacylase [Planctomycetia bacterium]|nr:D-aminoacyl-tRNA deacylase [Planctomycetia bacterium]
MRTCIQRVKWAKVTLPEFENSISGEIDHGLLVLLGVGNNDTEKELKLLAKKIVNLRIFEDDNGKMNKNVSQIGGKILVVSQFTLYADCSGGNRPGFTMAAPPEKANTLYEQFCQEIRSYHLEVATGRFQAEMHVLLLNDGPVTIWLDTDYL